MTKLREIRHLLICTLLCGFVLGSVVVAGNRAQWQERFSRNGISDETGLADTFDPAAGKNIKWAAQLGSESWATPVIAGGRVYMGTNNDPPEGKPHDPRFEGDRGVLLCLDEKDGKFLWQLMVSKLGPDPYLDWPRAGIVSPPSVEGDRAYVVTNRGEAACLDVMGQANGNDGPYMDEGVHLAIGNKGEPNLEPFEVTNIDADIIWLFDIPNQAGTWPHDAAHSSILIDGDFLYINTSNGLDNQHRTINRPDGPSLIVLDKKTGRLLARDNEGIGKNIFHSTWSSPALGVVNGRRLIFFCGGDGIVYAFEALKTAPPEGTVETLKRVWKFDCDPNAPKENVQQYIRNREVSPSNIKGMPVFYEGRIYVAHGGDIWWGKHQAWLKCIDATKTGEITESGLIWSCDLTEHCCSTPSLKDGLLFITDCGMMIRCIDAETGKVYWTHEAKGDMWASTLVADGKVYIGTNRGEFFIFEASKEKKLISEIKLDSATASTPVAANGVLYVATMHKLYAIEKPAQ
ncbi:MAG TPA: PQQ-binding-like beta-propeller repeat protein [Sedimentisphaerales bacterium]|nr:PQQ-binding-like beta-propeller repeat protein [Sedimentisphaerales bacterium]